jgi:hypothetical protein
VLATDIVARNVKGAGLGDRITVTPGDFFAAANLDVRQQALRPKPLERQHRRSPHVVSTRQLR